MGIEVQRQCFSSIGEVLDDVKKCGTWPTTFISGPSDGIPVHWHSEHVHAYIMEGETEFLDVESGKRVPVGPGDKLIIPPRTLHAEGIVKDRLVYIIGLPQPVFPDEFLKMRPPEELQA